MLEAYILKAVRHRKLLWNTKPLSPTAPRSAFGSCLSLHSKYRSSVCPLREVWLNDQWYTTLKSSKEISFQGIYDKYSVRQMGYDCKSCFNKQQGNVTSFSNPAINIHILALYLETLYVNFKIVFLDFVTNKITPFETSISFESKLCSKRSQ